MLGSSFFSCNSAINEDLNDFELSSPEEPNEYFYYGDYQDYFSDPEVITDGSLNTDIYFLISKKYDSSDMDTPLLKLKLVTAKFYPCKSYSIYITELIEDNKLIVELIGISKGELCLTAIGPAKSSDIKLPRNIDKISFVKDNMMDEYSIKTEQDSIIFDSSDLKFMKFITKN